MAISGLDPARPLIDRFAGKKFKLSKEDAYQVQVLHTNAGFLGEVNQIGHVDFCINGGTDQPNCKGHRIRKLKRYYNKIHFNLFIFKDVLDVVTSKVHATMLKQLFILTKHLVGHVRLYVQNVVPIGVCCPVELFLWGKILPLGKFCN